LASSCGRLFDAAAAAAGVSSERALYEGQAAIEFESLIDPRTLADEGDDLAYPFSIAREAPTGMSYIEPLAMWQALLGDLIVKTPTGVIAARFHKGLAIAIVRMLDQLSGSEALGGGPRRVALSGGVFQNKVLFEEVTRRLEALEYEVLSHRLVPSGDGGLCLGQAAIAAARLMN
jgi:hydrogenase maturation protein HypF